MVDAINAAYEKLTPAAPETTPTRTANASKRGIGGPVYVEITVDDKGALQSVKIGNDRFAETPGLGAKALEPAFAEQFVGKVPPLKIEDIDAITGATITTQAVIDGINTAYEKLLAQ